MLWLLGVYIHNLDPYAVHFWGNVGIRWYGLSYVAGFVLVYLTVRAMARRNLTPMPQAIVGDFILALVLGTILGGRLGYCVFYQRDLFTEFTGEFPFWGLLAINKGGMASHGGMIGVVIACGIFARRHHLPVFHVFDLTTLGGTLGIFFGRIANFVNGELVGRPCREDFPLAVKFPTDIRDWSDAQLHQLGGVVAKLPGITMDELSWRAHVAAMDDRIGDSRQVVHHTVEAIIAAVQSGNVAVTEALAPYLTARHPSQLYAALLEGLLLFVVLSLLWLKPRKPGVIGGTFLVGYALVRIFNEQFRMPDSHIGYQWLGLTRGQWLSIAMLLIGVACLIWWATRPAEKIGGWLSAVPKPRASTRGPQTDRDPSLKQST